MTTPPIVSGDLLLVSAGPGHFATVEALQRVASGAGARIVLVTATPDGTSARIADRVVVLHGPTMNEELDVAESSLLMGSAFELVQLLFYDVCVTQLLERRPQPVMTVKQRHTNLE
jgi:6-phospho-3-hexuloisomerase